MKRLQPPEMDGLAIFDEIARAKTMGRGPRLQGLRPTLETSYQNYRRLAPNLESLAPLSTLSHTDREDLSHCYSTPTEALRRMRATLQSLAHRCPYCHLNEADTLDHYLPKGAYHEFIVFPYNLVPCCSTCNGRRGDTKASSPWPSNPRRLVHMYFDLIENSEQLLTAKLERGASQQHIATFVLPDEGSATSALSRLYLRHADMLGLKDRYQLASVDKLREARAEIGSLISIYPDVPSTQIASFFRSKAQRLEMDNGRNHWESALAHAIADSEEGFIADSIARANPLVNGGT